MSEDFVGFKKKDADIDWIDKNTFTITGKGKLVPVVPKTKIKQVIEKSEIEGQDYGHSRKQIIQTIKKKLGV